MPRPKSLLTRSLVDTALRGHKCQHNAHHLITRGDRRLKVWSGRSYEHYCVECALATIERDIEKLGELERQLRGENAAHD